MTSHKPLFQFHQITLLDEYPFFKPSSTTPLIWTYSVRSILKMSLPLESSPTSFGIITTPRGLTLQVDFAWTKFKNQISEKNGEHLQLLYVQHFRQTKPQLRFDSISDGKNIASGTLNYIAIDAECTIRGQRIDLKPLKRWKTQYNYLSRAFSVGADGELVPISWLAESSLKIWDFVCVDSTTQTPIAKFSVNFWALKEVGNIYFEKSKQDLRKEEIDEVVITGLTLLYVMTNRMNNPFNLIGAMIAKPGKVKGDAVAADEVELAERTENQGKAKRL